MSSQPTSPWLSPELAPKTGEQIIADFGFGSLPQVAAWCHYNERWVSAVLNMQPIADGQHEVWFENEYEQNRSLLRWMPMPK